MLSIQKHGQTEYQELKDNMSGNKRLSSIYQKALKSKTSKELNDYMKNGLDEDVAKMVDYAKNNRDKEIALGISSADVLNDGRVMPSQMYGLMGGGGSVPTGSLAKAGAAVGAAAAGIMAGEEMKKKFGKGRTELTPPDVPTGTPAMEPTDRKTGETETMPEGEEKDNKTTISKDPNLDEVRKSLPFPVDPKTFEDLIEFIKEYPEVADVAGKMKAHKKTVEAWQRDRKHQDLTWEQIQEILENVSQDNAVRNYVIKSREKDALKPRGVTYEQKRKADLEKGEKYSGVKHSTEPSYSKIQEAEDFTDATGSLEWKNHHPRKTLPSDTPSK